MMLHPLRHSILASLGVALVAGVVPLGAQQRVDVNARRATRASTESAIERELRALERRVDSLAYLYSSADELSVARRRRIGEMLDRTVEQIDVLSARLAQAQGGSANGGEVRVHFAPMAGEAARTYMLRALTASRGLQPRGWLGIEVYGPAREPRIEDGERIVHYLGHPAIISVDPSSPAERAGILPGDTLIAYDGHDVSDADIPITRLLKPNKRVNVRIRRDGRERDMPVMIADVPSRITLRRELVEMTPPAPRAEVWAPGVRFPQPAEAPAAPRAGTVMRVPSPMPATPPAAPKASLVPQPMPSPVPGTVFVLGFGGVNAVAGAQLVVITEGLGRAFGVRSGVLVTNAPHGSPAYQSGLRDGDVVIRAAGQLIRTVADLRECVAAAANNGEHSVSMEYVRAKKMRKGNLRW